MTWSCARRGASGYCRATLSSARPGSRGVLRYGSDCVRKSQCREYTVKSGEDYAVRWDFQDPWTAQPLSCEATDSRRELLSCASGYSIFLLDM
eukprot:366360-Chlamydomonas_euryale.AAC.4